MIYIVYLSTYVYTPLKYNTTGRAWALVLWNNKEVLSGISISFQHKNTIPSIVYHAYIV